MSSEQASLPRERRIVRRRPVKSGVAVSARKGVMGLGPNLVLAPVTLSDDGISLRVKGEMAAGDEVEVCLTPTGRAKPTKMMGDIRWCRPGADGTFVIGVQFRHRLKFAELTELAQRT